MLLLVSCLDIAYRLKPRLTDNSVAEGFSHRLRPMKKWNIPLGGHVYDVSQIIQVNNWLIIICNISSPLSHAQLVCCNAIKKL